MVSARDPFVARDAVVVVTKLNGRRLVDRRMMVCKANITFLSGFLYYMNDVTGARI